MGLGKCLCNLRLLEGKSTILKIKHCTAKQTKSSHNVKTDSRFTDQKLSLVFFKPHERRLYEIH